MADQVQTAKKKLAIAHENLAVARSMRADAMSRLQETPAWGGVTDSLHALEKDLVSMIGRIEHYIAEKELT